MTIQSFRDLDAWKEGHKLVLMVYRLTEKFPNSEVFGLTNQLRRCAVSITSNVAEGFSRQSYKDKIQFYSISLGSLTELQSQILVASDVGYLPRAGHQELEDQAVKVHKILNGLIKSSKNHNS